MQNLKEIKELIEWAKTQSIKRLKLDNIEVEFNEGANLQPVSNVELTEWVNTLKEHSPGMEEVSDDLLYYSSNK